MALDETRQVYEPILWECRDDWSGRKVEQVWFPGTHGDVGGQLGGFEDARPLANMSRKAEGSSSCCCTNSTMIAPDCT